jgi:hypothetical protein
MREREIKERGCERYVLEMSTFFYIIDAGIACERYVILVIQVFPTYSLCFSLSITLHILHLL